MQTIVLLLLLIPTALGALLLWTAACILADPLLFAQLSVNAILCLIAGIACFMPVIAEGVIGLIELIKKKKKLRKESL